MTAATKAKTKTLPHRRSGFKACRALDLSIPVGKRQPVDENRLAGMAKRKIRCLAVEPDYLRIRAGSRRSQNRYAELKNVEDSVLLLVDLGNVAKPRVWAALHSVRFTTT